ncbi:MAG TPA: 3-phosphoshikimate 1-carboxyvinyltransferase [Candidatus Limnocylindrales bacterium]|nr:3-phosphoshikimate 1-carboxyvinyltransferase [Candidatus Limnocylindrales bacterium]
MTLATSGRAASPRPRAVSATDSLRGALRLPSDKSVAHRALLFNAMATGSADVRLVHPGQDVLSMVRVLRALGAVEGQTTDDGGLSRVTVRGGGLPTGAQLPGSGGEVLDCGNAGTAMRLLAGALAGRPAMATLTGDDSLSGRPMARIAEPLRHTGAGIETTDGHAPIRIDGRRPLIAVEHRPSVASAQVIGCLTLAALAAEGTTSITVPGPTRDHSERMLAWLGAPVRRDGLTTTVVGPAGFAARPMTVPGDISSAAAWLVAGALHPRGDIRLVGVGLNPSRRGIIEVLRGMGADIEVRMADGAADSPEPVGDIIVRGGRALRPIDIAGDRVADVIDELPLIGVAMAAAEGRSEVRDAAELRVKESDRIALVVENLAAIGAQVEERPDGWIVARGSARDASIRTAGDHRIAIAFAIAALTGVGGTVSIDDPACAAVSYPSFWLDMESLAR